MKSLCWLLLSAAIQAAPVWVEVEGYTAAEGQVELLDENARDFGRTAKNEAGGGAFLRIWIGTSLAYEPITTAAGEYHVWVRGFAIDGRRATVEIDGQPVGTSPGGQNRPTLEWHELGPVTLTAGQHQLGLRAAEGNINVTYMDTIALLPPGTMPIRQHELMEIRDVGERLAVDFSTMSPEELARDWEIEHGPAESVDLAELDRRRGLHVHNDSGGMTLVTSRQSLSLQPGDQVRVKLTARKRTLLEHLSVELSGVGTLPLITRKEWVDYEGVFLVPPGRRAPITVRLVFRFAGDTYVPNLVVEKATPPVSPFETGRFLQPPQNNREGRLCELERYLAEPGLMTAEDVDHDGKWTLARLGRDENDSMFSRGTVLKSDTVGSPPLEFNVTGLADGPYSAWLSDPGRPVRVLLGGGEPVEVRPGALGKLGNVVVSGGAVTLRAEQLPADSHNPGPVYLDYLLLVATENEAFVNQPVPAWPTTAPDTVDRRTIACTSQRAGVASGGVPLPQGELGDPSHVRLVGEGGPVPAQFKVLNRWPDGSIKWLLVTAADLPDGYGRLEYGREVAPFEAPAMTVQPEWSDDALWRSLPPFGRLTAELTLADGTVLRPTDIRHTLVEAGPVRSIHRVDARYAAGDRAPFQLQLRIELDRDAPGALLEHTFITDCPGLTASIRSLRLLLEHPGGPVRVPENDRAGATLRLVQDAGNVHGLPLDAAYRLEVDGHRSEGTIATGIVHAGAATVIVPEFVEQFPLALAADRERFAIELWPADAAQGPFIAHRGMAKTHRLRLAVGAPPVPVVNRLLFERDYLLQPGVLEPMATGESTATYDTILAEAFEKMKEERAGYGMENWGDLFQGGYVAGAKTWSNQEWDLVNTWLTAYARIGETRYFDFADAAARHYADVDIDHVGEPALRGAPWVHAHTAEQGHQLEAPNFAHAGWVEGLLIHYGLTGDERSLNAALGIADWVVRLAVPQQELTPSGPLWRLSQNRQSGWPLITLALAYRQTGDPKYVPPMRRIVDYLRRNQIPGRGVWEAPAPHEHPWRGGCVFAFTIFKGLDLYGNLTGDDTTADRLDGAKWVMGEMWRPPDRFMYEQCPTYDRGTDVGFLMLEPLAEATELSGNPLYLMLAEDILNRRIADPKRLIPDIGRAQWGNGTVQQAGRMMAAAEALLPARPEAVELVPTAEEARFAGATGVLKFTLRNRGDRPLLNLRCSTLIRGDWQATVTAPVRVEPNGEAMVEVTVTSPPPLEVVVDDNDAPFVHLLAEFELNGEPAAVRGFARARVVGE